MEANHSKEQHHNNLRLLEEEEGVVDSLAVLLHQEAPAAHLALHQHRVLLVRLPLVFLALRRIPLEEQRPQRQHRPQPQLQVVVDSLEGLVVGRSHNNN